MSGPLPQVAEFSPDLGIGLGLAVAVSVDPASTEELEQVLQWQAGLQSREQRSFSLAQFCRKIEDFLWETTREMYADKRLGAILRAETGGSFAADWQLNLLLCSDARIALWNREFRDKGAPTDILSFPAAVGGERGFSVAFGEQMDELAQGTESYGGDLLLSLRSWQSNCQEFSCDAEEELQRLLIHGLLHLAGLDHGVEDLAQAQSRMLQYQESLVKSSGQRRSILAQ